MNTNVPLIDFSKCGLLLAEDDVTELNFRKSGNELYAALSTSGFAYLTNHGFEWSIVDHLNEVAEKFYSLPLEVKMRFERQSLELCYDSIGNFNRLLDIPSVPFSSTTTSCKRRLMACAGETCLVFRANLRQLDYNEGLRASGAAFTDKAILWPNVPGLKESYERFAHVAGKLLMRLLKALGYGMKLKDTAYFCKAHTLMNRKGNLSIVKSLKYPAIDEDDVETENRVGEHTDINALTLLFQDEMGGLQVKDPFGKFLDVHPIPGAIVVNIGDILEAWSGKRLKATVHRVIPPSDQNKRGKVRRSVGYFGQADSHVLMKRLAFEDGIEDDQGGDDEKPITVEEHMNVALASFTSHKY